MQAQPASFQITSDTSNSLNTDALPMICTGSRSLRNRIWLIVPAPPST